MKDTTGKDIINIDINCICKSTSGCEKCNPNYNVKNWIVKNVDKYNEIRDKAEDAILYNKPIIYSKKEGGFLKHTEPCLGLTTGCDCEISNIYIKKIYEKETKSRNIRRKTSY